MSKRGKADENEQEEPGHQPNSAPVHEPTEESDRNKPPMLELDGVSLDKQKTMDSSYYEKKYSDFKFMWILDTGGNIDKYRRAGAVIQKDESDFMFEDDGSGYKGKNRGSYVSVIGGTDFGEPIEQILMKMPKDRYALLVTGPKTKRNEEIRAAMGIGQATEADRDGSNLETYAAHTPTGGQGFEQMAGQGGFNKLIRR